jgi:hypothetical protein
MKAVLNNLKRILFFYTITKVLYKNITKMLKRL